MQVEYMKATTPVKSAVIEGQTYEVPKDGVIKLTSQSHIETLKRHGFVEHFVEETDAEEKIDAMEDKAELVEFIEERGGEANIDMSIKKLRRLAKESLVEA